MHWLATSKHWQVFLFLLSATWLQFAFEIAEIFSDNAPEISSLAYSMIMLGLTLIWVQAVGSAMATGNTPFFSALCWVTAACYMYFATLSILAEDPEIFLQPSYLRPMFFITIWAFLGCTIYAAYKIEQVENPDSVSWLNIANYCFLLALSLLGVWSIQPKIQELINQ